MTLVVSGRMNKQVAGELGISGITVKAHRGKVMRKMMANSLADLVKMHARLCLHPPELTAQGCRLQDLLDPVGCSVRTSLTPAHGDDAIQKCVSLRRGLEPR